MVIFEKSKTAEINFDGIEKLPKSLKDKILNYLPTDNSSELELLTFQLDVILTAAEKQQIITLYPQLIEK